MISQVAQSESIVNLNRDTGSTLPIAGDSTGPPAKRRRVIIKNIVIKPSDYVRSAFKANGVDIEAAKSKAELNFTTPTQEMLNAYKPETLQCVRQNNIEELKQLHESGSLLNCCNKYGESLLHLACRRSRTNIVKFLLKEAKVNVNIRDDYRRTPLHDACWTAEPNFELVEMLIREVPEHLLMEDVRGFTPFDYVRGEHSGKWLRFLWERKSILCPLVGVPTSNQ
jgi:hypothetical protein